MARSNPGGPGAGSLSRRQALALASKQPGSVVLRAADAGGAAPGPAQFYVLRNAPALSNGAITDPHADPARDTRSPAGVAFGFTPSGRRAFEALTAASPRGAHS